MLTIIIPAFNEESVITQCLKSLLTQSYSSGVEVLIAANGCTDQTILICEGFQFAFRRKGYDFTVLKTSVGNKNKALNLADAAAKYPNRLYLDADIVCEPDFIKQAIALMDSSDPIYFSGSLSIKPGSSFFSNAYAKIWQAMPYIRETVTGIGCYGVNESGRKLWGDFPMIHSDDKYVRMLFSKNQRAKTEAVYYWPVPEGLLTLIKVRIRWIKGNRQLKVQFPDLNLKDVGRLNVDGQLLKTSLFNPVSTAVFLFVYGVSALVASMHSFNSDISWSRAR